VQCRVGSGDDAVDSQFVAVQSNEQPVSGQLEDRGRELGRVADRGDVGGELIEPGARSAEQFEHDGRTVFRAELVACLADQFESGGPGLAWIRRQPHRPLVAEGGAELLHPRLACSVEIRRAERRIAQRAIQLDQPVLEQPAGRAPIAVRVERAQLVHDLGVQVERLRGLQREHVVLERLVALTTHLGHVAETDADALPKVGTLAPAGEKLQVNLEGLVPVARLLGGRCLTAQPCWVGNRHPWGRGNRDRVGAKNRGDEGRQPAKGQRETDRGSPAGHAEPSRRQRVVAGRREGATATILPDHRRTSQTHVTRMLRHAVSTPACLARIAPE
jgi:hypothetical protein